MTIRYLDGTSIVTAAGADAIDASTGDFIIIGTNGVYGSTTSDGIDTAGAGQADIFVSVAGLVFGFLNAVGLDGATGDNAVTIEATGRAISEGSSAVHVAGGVLRVVNYGSIQSAVGIGIEIDASVSAFVLNTGTILPGEGNTAIDTQFGSAAVTLVNLGTMGAGSMAVSLSDLNDVVWNAGTVIGSVNLNDGDNLYQGPGQVIGTILAGPGADTIIGGGFDDTIEGRGGSDWLAGGGGDDLLLVGDHSRGPAILFGGTTGGSDTSTNDTVEMDARGGYNIFLTGNYITSVTNVLAAVMTGIENATGGSSADGLFGSAGNNVLNGGNGNDWIVGNGGADTFLFDSAGDADGDNIRDFRRSEGDRIDLSVIDANFTTAAEDVFVLRTVHTNNAAAEAVLVNYGTSAVVNLYTNADNIIDGTFVVVYGEAGVTSLTALDFLL